MNSPDLPPPPPSEQLFISDNSYQISEIISAKLVCSCLSCHRQVSTTCNTHPGFVDSSRLCGLIQVLWTHLGSVDPSQVLRIHPGFPVNSPLLPFFFRLIKLLLYFFTHHPGFSSFIFLAHHYPVNSPMLPLLGSSRQCSNVIKQSLQFNPLTS